VIISQLVGAASLLILSLREEKNLLNKQALNRSDKDIKVGTFLWQFSEHKLPDTVQCPDITHTWLPAAFNDTVNDLI
jgi:hypothetical protein